MQSVCRHCQTLASTQYPCKRCGSDSSMQHTHCTEEFHYVTPYDGVFDPNKHYFVLCEQTHTHPHLGDHDHAEDGSVIGDALPVRRPFKQREAYLLTAPWITTSNARVRCDGICYSRSSMSNRRQCKNRGKYRYRTLKRSPMKTGHYCWDHLPMFMEEVEMARWDRFIAKHPPEWKEQSNDTPEAPAAP